MLAYIVSIVIGYLLGCSSMAFYIAKLKQIDIHHSGTGNLGASNAMLTMGWAAGILTGLHDVGKGVLAVFIARRLFPAAAFIGLVAGSAAVLGHNFPFYLRFKGGKGLATYWGMILTVNWKLALGIALGIIVITLITDYIVIGSVATAVVFPVYVVFVLGWIALGIVSVPSLAMICRHKENFIRLKNGTEVGLRSAGSGKLRVK